MSSCILVKWLIANLQTASSPLPMSIPARLCCTLFYSMTTDLTRSSLPLTPAFQPPVLVARLTRPVGAVFSLNIKKRKQAHTRIKFLKLSSFQTVLLNFRMLFFLSFDSKTKC